MTKESKDGGTDEKRGWKGKLEEGNKNKKNMTKNERERTRNMKLKKSLSGC